MSKTFIRYITLLFIILYPTITFTQSLIKGYIIDKKTKQSLIGATIVAINGAGTTTDQNGYFNLTGVKDSLYASYPGYETKVFYPSSGNEILYVALGPVELDEVEVTASRPVSEAFGRTTIDVKDIKQAVYLLGEQDIFKRLALQAGVTQVSEFSSGISVRGGNIDQNITIVDGMNLYNTNHLVGFISPLNNYAIKSVDLHKGSFPAEFGGRLSSIIDVALDGGSKEETTTNASIGILNSAFKASGPIIKDKLSYNVAVRFSYPLLLASFINTESADANYYIIDGSIKLDYKLTDKHRFSLSTFNNKDIFYTRYTSLAVVNDESSFRWGNNAVGIQYFGILSNSATLTMKSNYSKFGFQLASDRITPGIATFTFRNGSGVEEYKNEIKYSKTLSNKLRYNAGIQASKILVKSRDFSVGEEGGLRTEVQETTSLYDANLFATVNYTFTDKIHADAGLRVQSVQTEEKENFINLQPRLKVNYLLNKNVTFNASYSRMNQAIQQLSYGSGYFPNEIWLAPTAKSGISSSDQYSAGVLIQRNKFEFLVEAFIKYQKGLLQVLPNNFIAAPSLSLDDIIAPNGIGRSRGIEVTYTRKLGKFRNSVAYTLSKTTRQFDDVNNGFEFPFRLDRRHDFEGFINYDISKKWSVGSTFQFTSGARYTAPVSLAVLPPINTLVEITKSLYNEQFPTYKRIDLQFTRTMKGQKAEKILSMGIYNIFGFKNASYIDLKQSIRGSGTQFIYQTELRQVALLRWIPFINYELKF